MYIAIFGVVIWFILLFQVLLGMRVIKLGKRHRVVHKWTAFVILALAPIHGLLASAYFLGWPFKIG
jgi:hypothetical protein